MDVVITYVDITERFKEQYSKYVKKELEENRFRSYGVLDLQIKGIRKYMPYIKNIFIVVSEKEQVEGIDLSDAIIVEHKDIIPERYLPCFNSCAIEMFLWKIPGLDEEFIYFNDDMFVIDKVHPTKWFIKGKPVLFPKEHIINNNEENIYIKNCINSSGLIINIINKQNKNIYYTQNHCPKPYLKSSCEKIFNLKIIDIIHSLTRTRHSKNYNCYLFNDYDFLSNNCYVIENKYIYTNTYDSIDTIIDYINEKKQSLICINDNDEYIDFNNFKILLKQSLELNLNNKKYIKCIKKEYKEEINILDNLSFKIALCAMGKNENLYIREWVEYYKNLGITKIFLYDNNEIDGEHFEDVINDYIENGFVQLFNVRGKTKYQLQCYIDFYNTYSKDYNWCCFFDIDEFLVLTKDNNISDYLNRDCFNSFNSIAINWKNYGDNNLLGNENNYNRNCLDRFIEELIEPSGKYNNSVYKKIIRGGLRKISKLESPHTFSPSLDKLVCNNYGIKINGKKYSCEINYNLAYLKHFCTKTILEYILKSKRGGGVNGLTEQYSNINNFFLYNEKTKDKENIINAYLNIDEKINLLVVNYNTPNLIDILIKNINMQIKSKYHLYIFDNSDKYDCYTSNDNRITIFDNTKGQIINFDSWLDQYPDRLNCWAKNNGWGSAKHCYSVEKCFDLINDNFILLDSDILIKKDISNLYREDLFYVGEIAQLKTQKLPRISPYICFINVKLCKLYDIHYFYPNYMHGLSKSAHNYDTGGAFYKFVNKYQHLNIVCNEYITHFGQGSWSEVANKSILKKNITIDDWLNQYKYLYDKTEFLKENVLNFVKNFNHNINLDNPITIQDKINWLKVYDVNELKGKCSDKIKIHEYSLEKLGKDICIPIIKIYNSPDDINLNDLPDKFVLKCNHGYNMNIICKDKKTFNLEESKEKCKEWLNKDFGQESLQLQYSLIDKKCFIEKYMFDENQTESLYDYKFWCFNGEPKLYTINNGNGHGDILYYNINQTPFDPYLLFKNKDINNLFKQPQNFELMRIYAKILSSDFKFVRVDFYEINNIVYLGELTFTPGNGIFNYKDKKYNKIIGDMLVLPNNYE